MTVMWQYNNLPLISYSKPVTSQVVTPAVCFITSTHEEVPIKILHLLPF